MTPPAPRRRSRYPLGVLSMVARRTGTSLSHVSRVASGERQSARISAALERTAAQLATPVRESLIARNVAG